MITIKPHHFMDIIKLYGKGIENFVPDASYNHDFYKVANMIIQDKQVLIKTTVGADDICKPCDYLNGSDECIDGVSTIKGYEFKKDWNESIDKRILSYAKELEHNVFTASEYCKIVYSLKEHMADIWNEEDDVVTNDRILSFCKGAEKYLLESNT